MRQLPNTLSALRLLGAIALLFCDVKGIAFWSVYLFCGISDMLDGFLARKLNAATPFGAVLRYKRRRACYRLPARKISGRIL